MQEEATASFRSSPQQEQLWLREPDGPSGRNQLVMALGGSIDVERLREAIATVIRRHEILRTTFQRRSGMRVPLQVVHDELPMAWRVVDGGEDIDAVAEAERGAAVSFDEGPVLRAAVAAVETDDAALILTAPSVFVDGPSLVTLTDEIAVVYGGGTPADEPLQYADFAAWQHELAETEGGDADQGKAFWAERGEVAVPPIPFLQSGGSSPAGEREKVALGAGTAAELDRRAEQFGIARELVALAAWHVTLRLISGSETIDVVAVLPDRLHAELEGSVGALARPVPVRASLAEEDTFAEVLDRVARAAAEASSWQDYAPELPANTVGFVAASATNANGFSPRELTLAADGSAVALEWVRAGDAAVATIVYDAGSYATTEAARLAAEYARVLDAVVTEPESALGEIDIVGDDERRRIVSAFNETRAGVPATTVDALVRTAIAARPGQRAVLDEADALTYEALDARVNQLAHRLRELGVGPGVVVGLCADRSVEMVVGLLGILRAGGAYLPLHYEHPAARLGHQLAETSARVLVTQSALVDRLPSFDGTTILLDNDRADLDARPSSAPDPAGEPDDLAYVMYTSGSTGTPKGVAVTNANLVNYVSDMAERLGASEEPLTFALVTAISTDLGNTSVFPALCSGGTLSLVSPATAADPGLLAARMREEPVDVIKITPSHLSALLASGESSLLPRKWLVTGGEACSWDIVARVRELSDCKILNHYGPTETTIGSCTFVVEDGPGEYAPQTVPIGRPIRNTACYILDARGRPTPVGVAGSLFIAGAGVARGYVGQDELTAERFVADPFRAVDGGRMYATGDLARWLPDGAIEFLGRADEQVKIRGFRVEPAEIEATLRKLPTVREAAVVAREEPSGEKRLVAYVVDDKAVDADALRAHVAQWVPEFMIPSAFVAMDELPRTPSGKIDRLALPEPDAAVSRTEAFVAPRTPTEQKLAAIWADVLNVERVGVHDDFFALGGHSLLATQIIAQIRTDFAVDLPLHSLFTSPTVELLAEAISELAGGEADAETSALLAELEGLSEEEAAELLGKTQGDAA
jgi:amino acid adenylation domain-containing protein